MSRIAKAVLLALVRGYKWAFSPILPPACRYVPTCSEYAMEAIDRRGALRGAALAVWRLLRCHPFAQGGFDPLPERGIRDACPSIASKDGTAITKSPSH
jgi:uncharacterized protein